MGGNLSTEALEIYNTEKIPSIICNCGDYAPYNKGGSCRHCYGYLKK